MKFKYGREELELDLRRLPNQQILRPQEKKGLANPKAAVESSLLEPIASPSLTQLAKDKAPDRIVIIVNDVSRATPYDYMLAPLLAQLHAAGVAKEQITFIIATGIHEPNTEAQNREIFGEKLLKEYRFISHDPDQNLVDLGELSSGNKLYLNREVVEADLLIATGVIVPHYFAGFSGGRKSILPGVAGRESIQNNHSRMVDLLGNLPSIKENPVNQEMLEAAQKAGVDFILNVVTNSKKEIVEVVAGDCKAAWYEGVKTSSAMYHVPLAEKVDVAIVSAGGYPKDINMYQAQKALDNANYGVKDGGTIILAAQCQDGLGEEVFADWLANSDKPEDNICKIKEKFVVGGHKAFAISKVVTTKDFILISDFDQQQSKELFAKKATSIEEALAQVEKKHGSDYTSIVMPQGALTLPVIRD